ncbi:MAG: holo-ACP synthase [Actinomycetota bacterium]|nr:holo-ACP synthase [Actinomycetota bacterium]
MSLRVGTDLASVELVEESVRAHGERYLNRVFTERELADCRTAKGLLDAERLAARFAAKEAALKVLRPGDDEGLALTSIEVVRAAQGYVDLALSGRAASIARDGGLSEFAVSITHEGGFAAAVVVAEASGGVE